MVSTRIAPAIFPVSDWQPGDNHPHPLKGVEWFRTGECALAKGAPLNTRAPTKAEEAELRRLVRAQFRRVGVELPRGIDPLYYVAIGRSGEVLSRNPDPAERVDPSLPQTRQDRPCHERSSMPTNGNTPP